jgi:urease accessory protein
VTNQSAQTISPDRTESIHRPPRIQGRLQLAFRAAEQGGATTMRAVEQTPPLRVVRPFAIDDGAALVHLHNISGGVLGGDHLTLGVAVEAGAAAQVTSTGATRVYRHRAGGPDAAQESSYTVAPNAILEVLPDALIPFAGARYRQTTRYALAANAGLFAWEIVSAGREAHGEEFAYDMLELETEIVANGDIIAYERMRLEPALRPLTSPVRMGVYRNFATFYICRVGQPPAVWSQMEGRLATLAAQLSEQGTVVWGASARRGRARRKPDKSGHCGRAAPVLGSGKTRAVQQTRGAAAQNLLTHQFIVLRRELPCT